MKLSVSLTADDVRALDELAVERGLPSRSAVVQQAVRELRRRSLADDYAAAFTEWDDSAEAADWDGVVADGIGDATR